MYGDTALFEEKINMTFLDAFIFGVVEGVSEFLPISSTGHLILTAHLLDLKQTEFLKMFEVVIQLGAILSIIFLYAKKVFGDFELMKRLIVAIFPALVVGGFFYSSIKQLFDSEVIVVWSLLIGGMLILLFEQFHTEKEDAEQDLAKISYWRAFFIGVFQTISVIPGVSRSGATIIGGLLLGLDRKVIVEFSFLLAVPTMLAASILDIYRSGGSVASSEWGLLVVGFVVAFLTALGVVKWLLRFVKSNTFRVFGIYRIALAFFFFLFIL